MFCTFHLHRLVAILPALTTEAPPLDARRIFVMQLVLLSVGPMGLLFLAGFLTGRLFPDCARWTGWPLKALISLLLFYCGRDFSVILEVGPTLARIITISGTFALATTAISWAFIHVTMRPQHAPVAPVAVAHPLPLAAITTPTWRHAFGDCVVALATVALGAIVGRYDWPWLDVIGTTELLRLMVLLIGIDVVEVPFAAILKDRSAWAVPLSVIAGSAAGGLLAALVTHQSLANGLAFSSGFGWVTLSAILVRNALGEEYGAIMMVTDLFRELLAITALYLLGARYLRQPVGICGATALDATLPLIRARCGVEAVPLALLSGLVLTLVSPLLIAWALATGH